MCDVGAVCRGEYELERDGVILSEATTPVSAALSSAVGQHSATPLSATLLSLLGSAAAVCALCV